MPIRPENQWRYPANWPEMAALGGQSEAAGAVAGAVVLAVLQ